MRGICFGFRGVCKKWHLFWLYIFVPKVSFLLTIDVTFAKLNIQSVWTSDYQHTTGFKISGRKLERLLKLIIVKFHNNTTSFVAHTTLWTEISSYILCLFTDLKLKWAHVGYYEPTWYPTLYSDQGLFSHMTSVFANNTDHVFLIIVVRVQ
jgi:hypothetical protein